MSEASIRIADPMYIHNRSFGFNPHTDRMFFSTPLLLTEWPLLNAFRLIPSQYAYANLFTNQIHFRARMGSLDPPLGAAASLQALSSQIPTSTQRSPLQLVMCIPNLGGSPPSL